MKTRFWMLSMAVAVLASCTQNEVVEIPERNAIGFDSFVGKNSRAGVTSLENDNLKHFYVFGHYSSDVSFTDVEEVFDNIEFSINNVTSEWEVTKDSDTRYWEENMYYRFAAYSDGNFINNNIIWNPGTHSLDIKNYTPDIEKDLVAYLPMAKHADQKFIAGPDDINLNFIHLLTRVNITFYNVGQSNNVIVKDVELSNIRKTETCTITLNGGVNNIAWTHSSSFDPLTYLTGEEEIIVQPGEDKTITLENFVIPQNINETGNQVVLSFKTFKDNSGSAGEKIHDHKATLSHAGITYWNNSIIYNYVVRIYDGALASSSVPIEFTPTINGWTPSTIQLELDPVGETGSGS